MRNGIKGAEFLEMFSFKNVFRSRLLNKRVKLNVGGIRLFKCSQSLALPCLLFSRHEVLWKILEQIPHSRLGLLSKVTIILPGRHINVNGNNEEKV